MPKLIRWRDGNAAWADDPFASVADDEAIPAGDVIVSLTRFLAEGEALLSEGRSVGVRLEATDCLEDLAYDLPRIAVVAAVFPKFRDGRAYTTAQLLRQRYDYLGEIRAVGDVLRDQAGFMVRVGFNAFEPADGSAPEEWARAAHRHRHVYQRAADGRATAFAERGK